MTAPVVLASPAMVKYALPASRCRVHRHCSHLRDTFSRGHVRHLVAFCDVRGISVLDDCTGNRCYPASGHVSDHLRVAWRHFFLCRLMALYAAPPFDFFRAFQLRAPVEFQFLRLHDLGDSAGLLQRGLEPLIEGTSLCLLWGFGCCTGIR